MIWRNRSFGWEPSVGNIGCNYFVCKLNDKAAKSGGLSGPQTWEVQGLLALGVAGSGASVHLSFLWAWPQAASAQLEKWSRQGDSSRSSERALLSQCQSFP